MFRDRIAQKLHELRWSFRSRIGRLYALFASPRGGVCAEVGVWAGAFSARIIQLRRPRELHLIDPWRFAPQFPERMYGGAVALDQAYMDELMGSVANRFADNPNVKIHRCTSLEASREFDDCYFVWIYLDGDHSYDAVLADLNAWFPKIKAGGRIVCDDYTWLDENRNTSMKAAIHAFLTARSDYKSRLVLGQFLIQKTFRQWGAAVNNVSP
jgi:hypothetical protein